jgi:hypothetical protein
MFKKPIIIVVEVDTYTEVGRTWVVWVVGLEIL